MGSNFRIKKNSEIKNKNRLFYKSSFNFVFEQPSYWNAINTIVGGDLYLAYLENNQGELDCWLPFILKTENKVTIINSLPYFGSHGGPYGPNKDEYNNLIEQFFEYCKLKNFDSSFISLSIEASDLINETIKSKYLIDFRIGQITNIPNFSENIESDLFDKYHVKTRNAVRKGKGYKNASLLIDSNDDLFSEVLKIHQDNIEVLGGTPKFKEHFDILKSFSGNEYKVRLATYIVNNDIACALISLITSKTYEYFTPVLNQNYRSTQLLSRLINDEMIYASKNNLKYWNWGGTWSSQHTVYRFKSRWGAQDLNYYYLFSENKNIVEKLFEQKKVEFNYMYKFKFKS